VPTARTPALTALLSTRLSRLSLLGLLMALLALVIPTSHSAPEMAVAATAGGRVHDDGAAEQTADPHQHVHAGANGVARPQFVLTWGAEETYAGVPIPLTIELLDAAGMPDTSRGGTILLLVDDVEALVTPAGAAPDAARLEGTPATGGRRFSLPFSSGKAELALIFNRPGRHQLLANLAGAIEVAGETKPLQVRDSFLSIQGPGGGSGASGTLRSAAVSEGADARHGFTVAVRDEFGKPVPGFAGQLVLTTTDAGAEVVPAGSAGGERLGRAVAARRLTVADQGTGRFEVAFATGGMQTVEVFQAEAPSRRSTLSVTVEDGGTAAPRTNATPTPMATPTGTPTATATRAAGTPTTTATATGTATPARTAGTPTATASATATTAPRGTAAPSAPPTTTATTAPRATAAAAGHDHHDHSGAAAGPSAPVQLVADRVPATAGTAGGSGIVGARTTAYEQQGTRPISASTLLTVATASFSVTPSTTTTFAGVPLTMTVRALDSGGMVDTGYRGTIKLTSTDSTFAPGTSYRYTFTATDAGEKAVAVTFNTAGATQTITVIDTVAATVNGTSAAVNVAETVLTASWGGSTAVQGAATSLTIQATDGSSNLVTGYRGRVKLTTPWGGIGYWNWGTGVDTASSYTFTATDAGSHTFTPKFSYAGEQVATAKDMAQATRTVTSGTITITNSPAGVYSHGSAPVALQLPDGSLVWAILGVQGQLYVRRNVGTLSDPAYRPLVVARNVTAGNIGADSPSLVRLGSTLALFHTYTDGMYFQIWVTTSTDDGTTWATPVKITNEAGHVAHVQAVVDGSTVYLFWSRDDTNRGLYYQSSTDLVNWTARATAGQQIGVPAGYTTSNFAVTKLPGGAWLAAWLFPVASHGTPGVANDLSYPAVHTATSTNLSAWTAGTDLTDPWLQKFAKTVALAVEPASGTVYAAYNHYVYPGDEYIYTRTSTNGTTWAAEVVTGYNHQAAPDGHQAYEAAVGGIVTWTMPIASSGSGDTLAVAAGDAGRGSGPGGAVQGHLVAERKLTTTTTFIGVGVTASVGDICWGTVEPAEGPTIYPLDPSEPEYPPVPLTGDPRQPDCPTGECNNVGEPVNTVTGYGWTSGIDLAAAAKGLPLVVSRTYNSYDGVARIDGPFGYGWSWGYGTRALTRADGSVTIVEANGRRAHYWKTGSTWTAAPHLKATLVAGGSGGYVLTRHDQSVWTFDVTGKLIAIADPNGNTVTLSYTGTNLSSVTAAGGRSLTITTNGQGRITGIAGPGGLATSYTYSTGGDLLTATDAAGAVTTYTYDSRHQLLTVVDGNSHTVETNTYGSLGRIVEQRNALSGLLTFERTEQGPSGSAGYSTFTDPRGFQYRYFNDGELRLTKREVRQGSTLLQRIQFTYAAAGNVLTATDPNNRVTTYTYDSRSNVLTATADSGTGGLALQATYSWDAKNNLVTATDPLSHTTTYTYDTAGNRLTAADALGHTTTYAYDTAGQLTSVTDATSRTVTFGYSTAGDLTSVTVPGGAVWTLGYDGAGRLTSVTDPLMHTTTFVVDGMGRTTSTTNALSQTMSVLYDAVGNRTRITDALSHQSNYAYDALNRLTSVTDALSGVTTYGYDATSNLTSVTNALGTGHTWTYTYDGLGRLLTAADPLSNTTTYTYDPAGVVATVRKPDTTVNRYIYDRVYRLTGIDLTNNGGTPDIQYAYDAASRRTSMTDGTGQTTYAYDNANRLTAVTAPGTGTVGYGYDNADRRTSITYPSSHQVTYGYTTRGELGTVTDWLTNVTTYTYDAAGRLTGIALPNGVTTTQGYDNADRLTSITHAKGGTTLEAISYALNAIGNRTSMTDGAGTTTWTYDAIDRLTNASYPNGDVTAYGYDAAGNRTTHTVNGVLTTNTFDAANRMTASGTATYTYDTNGNQTGRTLAGVATTYSYDALNRLAGIGGAITASYSYNGDGLRTSKTTGGTTTTYTWDPAALPVVLADGDEYVWGNGLLSQVTAGGAATYAHADGLGSIRLLTDGTGAAVGTKQYDAFGAVRAQTGTQLYFGYTGEQMDAESGLVYLRARYLNVDTGRFLSVDPFPGTITRPASQHAYLYTGANPINWTDPTGWAAGFRLPARNTWDCDNLPGIVKLIIDELQKKWDDRARGINSGNTTPTYGTVQGHITNFEGLKNALRAALKKWDDNKCPGDLPSTCRKWLQTKYPMTKADLKKAPERLPFGIFLPIPVPRIPLRLPNLGFGGAPPEPIPGEVGDIP
jgi:RHS repeat-associated protein